MEIPIIGEKVEATEVSEFFDDINERYEIRVTYYEEQSSILVTLIKILTLGLFALFELWFIKLRLWNYKLTKQPSHLLIKKMKNGIRMSSDQLVKCKSNGERIKFRYQYVNYVITSQNRLQKLELLTYDQQELSKYEAQQRQALFGENIMQIEERTKGQILIHEILSPFNIFQVFSFIVWSLDEYYLYAVLIAILTIVQIAITLRDLDQQNHKIRQMIYYETNVVVHRDQRKWHISSKDLVPGDIVEVNANQMITYDGILIIGEAVFNEAILTGEGTPVLKTSDMQIFSGCTCLQASQDCLAMVQQIAFSTVKGSLARYILFNNAYQYSFQKESLKYLLVLGILGLILCIINYFIRIQSNTSKFNSVIEALEIFTIMIPPSLPTALGAGLQVAVQRLQQHSIFCIKPDKINVSGMVDMIGFDKTGTLTESTLKVLGCVELKQLMNPNQCSETMQLALKSCHSLVGGCGDSLEIAMLECCTANFNFECLKVYQFEAHLQRMTVIIKYKGRMFAITKGSPEIMERLCFQTLPEQYSFLVKNYSQEGYRLITFGYKLINDQNEERKYIENGLQYLGILVFMNNLREDSKDLIRQLNQNNIKVFMVTGDNVLTSINVAKQCYILDPNKPVIVGEVKNGQLVFGENTDILEVEQMDYQVALSGESWEMVNKSILDKTKVFARMQPSQKGNLMLKMKCNNSFTAFCGDGCNDICALQQSDIGLALSNQEASLAAPFITPIMRPSQILEILKSGRCALITSQSCFKFMTLYSSIQTVALTLCYLHHTNFTVSQFLYQDLWIIIPLAFTMGMTRQAAELSIQKPFISLLSKSIINSIVGLFMICTLSQIAASSFYDDSLITPENSEQANPINSQQIILANTQVIAVSIAYSQGKPFREPIYRNYYLIFVLIIAITVHITLIIHPLANIICLLTSEGIIQVFIMNGIVFIVIQLYENICVKQYHY